MLCPGDQDKEMVADITAWLELGRVKNSCAKWHPPSYFAAHFSHPPEPGPAHAEAGSQPFPFLAHQQQPYVLIRVPARVGMAF